MRRRSVLILVVLLSLSAACSTPTDRGRGASPTGGSTATSSPTREPRSGETPDENADAGVTAATAYFAVADTQRAFVTPETHPLDRPTVGVARAAMEELVAGPRRDSGLSTLAPPGTRVLGAAISGGTLVVDLSRQVRETGHSSTQEQLFAQQLAWTGAQFDTVDAVRLHVEGEPVTQLWGHLDWSRPVTPDEAFLAPVVVTSPTEGATVAAGTLIAEGTANTFEATVTLELAGPDSQREQTFATATCGSGCRGDWSATFDTRLTPGAWTLRAGEPDPSGGEGFPPYTATTEFTVA